MRWPWSSGESGSFRGRRAIWRGCGLISTCSWDWRSWERWPWGSGTRPRLWPSCTGCPKHSRRLSLDYARRSIRALLELAPPTAERIGAGWNHSKGRGEPDSPGRPRAGSHRRHDSRRRHGGTGAVERRPEDDHGRVGSGAPGGGRSGLRGDDQWRRDAGSSGRGAGRRRAHLAGASPRSGPARPAAPRSSGESRGSPPFTRRSSSPCRCWSCLCHPSGSWPRAGPGVALRGSGASGSAGAWWFWSLPVPCALVIATPVAVVCGLAARPRGRRVDPRGRVPRGDRPVACPGFRQDRHADERAAGRRRGRVRTRSRR